MNQHSKPRGIRKTILNSTAIFAGMAAVLSPGMAAAQDAPPEEEVIVVTGTRIARPDFQFSNPVVSSTAEEIQNSGTSNLLDYLETVPALNNSLNGTEGFPNSGFSGVDLLNLRNLGVNRTLVLVDGKRHLPGNLGTSAVDVSTIPQDLVARVDVLTGGASAVYGSDGVSGVVNFIMVDDFEGLRLRAEAGFPTDDGQETQFVSATWGANFAQGRGNIAASLDYTNETRLVCEQRSYCIDEVRFVDNPNPGGPYGAFRKIPLDNLVWFSSGRRGAVDTDGDIFIANFDGGTDTPWDFGTDFDPPNGVYDIGFTYGQGGDGTPTAGYTETLMPEVQRLNLNLFGHFDVSNNMQVYGSLKAGQSEALNIIQPTFDYGYAISLDNPFIPANISADAITNGQTDVFVTRDHFELGFGGERIERDFVRGVAGVQGDITDHIRYDVSFTGGELNEDLTFVNARWEDRFAAAIDVVDPDGAGPLGPTCRVNVDPAGYLASFNLVDREANTGLLDYPSPISFTPGANSGCLPLNTFGEGNASAAAIDWIMNDVNIASRQRQQVFSAALNGDLGTFLELQGGSIGWAAGVEWRRESLLIDADANQEIGVTESGAIPDSFGAYEVSEVFGELSLPILADMPFAESLTLDWAHRYADYSTLGSFNTWKVGLSWQPIDDLRFRATKAEAIRAPNINDLFAPSVRTFQFINDPCDSAELPNAPDVALRTANCATILAAVGADAPGVYADPFAAFTKRGHVSGNSTLSEESAESWTFGTIYQPSWFNGFAFSADYYDITIANAIRTVDPQDIADQCVDAVDTTNEYCSAITRQNGGAGAGGIIDFVQQPRNVASYTTRGVDFTIAYRFDSEQIGLANMGNFEVRAVGNNTMELGFVPLPGSDRDDDLGESQLVAPEWQLNFDVTWEVGPWTTHYGYNFSTDLLRFENDQVATNVNYIAPEHKYMDGIRSHNIQVRYNFDEQFEVYGGVNNIGVDYSPIDLAYDPNGQFVYIGAVARFGGGQ